MDKGEFRWEFLVPWVNRSLTTTDKFIVCSTFIGVTRTLSLTLSRNLSLSFTLTVTLTLTVTVTVTLALVLALALPPGPTYTQVSFVAQTLFDPGASVTLNPNTLPLTPYPYPYP